MSFEVRILDEGPYVAAPRPFFSDRARVAHVGRGLARLALAGPPAWRRAAKETLLGVARVLLDVLDGGAALPRTEIHTTSLEAPQFRAPSMADAMRPATPRPDRAWAVWM